MAAKPGVKTSWTRPETTQVQSMLDRGISQREIAHAMGCNQSSISRLAAKLRDRREAFDGSPVLWDVIADDPQAWLREQDNILFALLRLASAYDEKCASGPPGEPRGDWETLVSQRDGVLVAYRVEGDSRKH